jgi:hypothetical protein
MDTPIFSDQVSSEVSSAMDHPVMSSNPPSGHGELVMCIPKGGLQEFISLNSFPAKLEYNIMTMFTDTKTLAIYKPGGDFTVVTTSQESFGYSESDIWTAQELATYNSEILFKRGLAKMAVAAMSYKISQLIEGVATMSNATREKKKMRKSIVKLSTKRKNAMNYLRSRTKKFSTMSKSFDSQDLVLRIVATCYDEFLSDMHHPLFMWKDNGVVHKMCMAVLSTHTDDAFTLQELLTPPGNKKKDDITLAFTIDEIVFSGNM